MCSGGAVDGGKGRWLGGADGWRCMGGAGGAVVLMARHHASLVAAAARGGEGGVMDTHVCQARWRMEAI